MNEDENMNRNKRRVVWGWHIGGYRGVSEKGRCHHWLVRRVFVLFLIIILLSFMVLLLPLSGPFRDASLGHYGGSLFITG